MKATPRSYGRILRRIDAHHVIYPEYDAGARAVCMVSGKILNYIEMGGDFSIIRMRPPRDIQGLAMAEPEMRERLGITTIDVETPGQPFEYVTKETKVGSEDAIVVSGDSAPPEELTNR